ncbi:hypothetical protein [Paenibacillus flagellatus]|uniref:VCBS repeat-containing protein n=1 Tax=Paenibacillus flagellatus TaxID=2211139 RepID=A0A2V5KEN9_9BACL|nr:hypothetical protein [Paenibacillus flagellatus]PYI56603.1 hypothetical protein DLM86_06450 [Paenibacillus flagellatus]
MARSMRIWRLAATGAAALQLVMTAAACGGPEGPGERPAIGDVAAAPTAGPSAPGASGGAGSEPAKPDGTLADPVVVGEGDADLNGDGVAERIRIWWTEGREMDESSPGPFAGAYRSGKFEAAAYESGGRELARFALNEAFGGGEMSFRKAEPFPLRFDDYNGDGAPDFAIGQRGGTNGSVYALLTASSDGFRVLAADIYSADSRESIRYRKAGERAFVNTYYDQQKGAYMDVVRRWRDGTFVAEEPAEAKEARPAGLEDG